MPHTRLQLRAYRLRPMLAFEFSSGLPPLQKDVGVAWGTKDGVQVALASMRALNPQALSP